MATISQSIALQDRMSTVFNKIHQAAKNVMNGFTSISNSVNKMQQNMNNASSSSNSFLRSLMNFGAVQGVFNMITGSVGSAIERFDTLNNFPNVMSNMGIGAEESQASLDRLVDGLDGLPTTLNAGAAAVQRFTSSNKNIGYSTEMFLALNNAILAGRSTNGNASYSIRTIKSSLY